MAKYRLVSNIVDYDNMDVESFVTGLVVELNVEDFKSDAVMLERLKALYLVDELHTVDNVCIGVGFGFRVEIYPNEYGKQQLELVPCYPKDV